MHERTARRFLSRHCSDWHSGRDGAIIQVLDVAEPSAKRSSAKRAQIASVTEVGVGILLLIFVFLREAMNKAATNPITAARFESLMVSVRHSLKK